MAIIDTSITGSFNEDRDENIFIGLDLPIRKSDGVEGYFASTSTTIASVKNNIRSLLLTNKGERYLQPDIGLNLRRYLFEQIDSEIEESIKIEIVHTFQIWLPFVEIRELNVSSSEGDRNILKIFVSFNIKNNQHVLESVEVDITGE
jgi:phage baseplate assembly protein W